MKIESCLTTYLTVIDTYQLIHKDIMLYIPIVSEEI
jgi:hypothetical protein